MTKPNKKMYFQSLIFLIFISFLLFPIITKAETTKTINVAVILAEPAGTPHNTELKTYQPCKLLPEKQYAGFNKEYYQDLTYCVNDYYKENSYGTVDLNFTIFDNNGGWYKITDTNKNELYYGKNFVVDNKEQDKTREFIWDVINLADGDINYNDYDTIIVVHSGKSESTATLIEILLKINKDWLRSFMVDAVISPVNNPGEKAKNLISLSEIELTGVWAHELGHAIGVLSEKKKMLPDLYKNSPNGYVGAWDVMGEGFELPRISWVPQFTRPSHFSSYNKIFLDWLKEEKIAIGTHTAESLETMKFGETVKRYNLKDGSYYLLEARINDEKYSKWDTALPGVALNIYKVKGDIVNLLRVGRGDWGTLMPPFWRAYRDDINNVLVNYIRSQGDEESFKIHFKIQDWSPQGAKGVLIKSADWVFDRTRNVLGPTGPVKVTDGIGINTDFKKDKLNLQILAQNILSRNTDVEQKSSLPKSLEEARTSVEDFFPMPVVISRLLRILINFCTLIALIIVTIHFRKSIVKLVGAYLIVISSVVLILFLSNILFSGILDVTIESPCESLGMQIALTLSLLFVPVTTIFAFKRFANKSSKLIKAYLIIIFGAVILYFLLTMVLPLTTCRFFAKHQNLKNNLVINNPVNSIKTIQEKNNDQIPKIDFRIAAEPEISEYSSPIPDLDLHAYDDQGRHVGINYETGEYENQIPEANASGDLVYDDEWIFVPETTNVRFVISSYDIQKMLEEYPELQELTDGIESYEVQAIYYDAASQRYESNILTEQIQPGQLLEQPITGTTDIQVLPAQPFDTIAPTTSISLEGVLGQNNWYVSNVVVNLTAVDNENGTGVEKTEYSFDLQTWFTYTEPFTISQEGINQLYYRSIDKVSNLEEINVQEIKIDKTPPEISIISPIATTYFNTQDSLPLIYAVNDNIDPQPTITVYYDSNLYTQSSINLGQYFGQTEHALKVTAIDEAGNTNEKSVIFKVIPQAMKSFLTKKMTIFWGLDCPEIFEELEEINDFEGFKKKYQTLERKLPKKCFKKKDNFTIFGSLELPDEYQKTDLDKSALFYIQISDKLGRDEVAFKELKNLWLYQEPWKKKDKPDDSWGQGMDIKTAIIHWLSERECKLKWQCQEKFKKNWFYIRGELSLEGIDVNTLPGEATITLEIPIAPYEKAGSLAGKETIEFKKFYHTWFYHSPIKWKDWQDGWWKQWDNDGFGF